MESFLVFEVRLGVGDDASSDVVVGQSVFVDEGADGDVELGFAIEPEVADGAGVESTGGGLEFGDDFASPLLGGTGDGPAGRATG